MRTKAVAHKIFFIVATSIALIITGCGGGGSGSSPAPKPKGPITVSASPNPVAPGNSTIITYTANNLDDGEAVTITAKISDPNVTIDKSQCQVQ